ncbi:MAG: hypothetical protein ACFFCW_15235 [Candidatus Hodarchaeota archaeon]
MRNTTKDLRYLDDKNKFIEYAFLALGEHFSSRDEFLNYFEAIKTDDRKSLFLRTASYYLFLVKHGDWAVDVPGSDRVIDYLTNTYKYAAIFSLIESLSEETYIEFYEFLVRRKSSVQFPITDQIKLEELYGKYKEEFGAIKRCISFFRKLSPERQRALLSRLEVRGAEATIESLAKYLYELRSNFVHEAELVLHMSEGMSIGQKGDKLVVCKLSIRDAMIFFEEGLIKYFREIET